MNKISTFLISGVLVISGCSSPETLRKMTPNLIVSSGKSAKTVAVCIANKWETSAPIYQVNFRPSDSGFQISALNQFAGFVDNMVDIEESASGSTTKHFSNSHVQDKESFAERVKICQ